MGFQPGAAQGIQSRIEMAFREFSPVIVQDQIVVEIDRRRQAEQFLQQSLPGRRVKEIAPAHDMGDALDRVVDDD